MVENKIMAGDRFTDVEAFLNTLERQNEPLPQSLVAIKTDPQGNITNPGEIFHADKLQEVEEDLQRQLGPEVVGYVGDFVARLNEEAFSIDDIRRITREEIAYLKGLPHPHVNSIEEGISRVIDPVMAELWRVARMPDEGGRRVGGARAQPAEVVEQPLHRMEPVEASFGPFVYQGTTYTDNQIDGFRNQIGGIQRQIDNVVRRLQELDAEFRRQGQNLYDRAYRPQAQQGQRLTEDQYEAQIGLLADTMRRMRGDLELERGQLVGQLAPLRDIVKAYDRAEIESSDTEEQIEARAVDEYCMTHYFSRDGEGAQLPPGDVDESSSLDDLGRAAQNELEGAVVRDDWRPDLGPRRRIDAILNIIWKKVNHNPDELARRIGGDVREQIASYKAILALWYDGWKNPGRGGVGKSFIETIQPLGGVITGWHFGRLLADPVIEEAVHTKYGHSELHDVAKGDPDVAKKRLAYIIRRTTGNSIEDDKREILLSARAISRETWQRVLEVPDLPVEYRDIVTDVLGNPTVLTEIANSADYELFRNVTLFAYLITSYDEHYKGLRNLFLREFERPHLLTGNPVTDYENLVDLYYYTAWTHPSMAPYWARNLEKGLKGGGLSPGGRNFIGMKNMVALGWDPHLDVDTNLTRIKRPDQRNVEYSLARKGMRYFDFDALNLPENSYRVVYVETDDTAYRAVTINQGSDNERTVHLRPVYVQGEVEYDRPNNQGNPKSVMGVDMYLTRTPEGFVLNTTRYDQLRGKSVEQLIRMNSSEIRRLTGVEKKAWMQIEEALTNGGAVWQYNVAGQLEEVTELHISPCAVPQKRIGEREFIDYGIHFSERGFNTNMGGIVNGWAQYMGYMMDLRISLMNMAGKESYLEKFKIWKEEIMSYERRKHVRWSELLGETTDKMEEIGERMSDMFLGWIWNNRSEGAPIVKEARELLRMGLKEKFYSIVHFKLLGIDGNWSEAQYGGIDTRAAVRMSLQEMGNKTVMQEGYLEGLIEGRLTAKDPRNRFFEYRIYDPEVTDEATGVVSRRYVQRRAQLGRVPGEEGIVYSEAEGMEVRNGQVWEERTPDLNWRRGEQVKWNVLDDFYDALVSYSRSKITREIDRGDLARRRNIMDDEACVQLAVLGPNEVEWKRNVLYAVDLHPYTESVGVSYPDVENNIFRNMFRHAIETYPGGALWTVYELGDLHKIKYKLVDRYVERKWEPLHTDPDPHVLAVPFDAWERLVYFYSVYRSMKYSYGGEEKVNVWHGDYQKVQGSYIVDPLRPDPIEGKGVINHLAEGLDILQSELVGTGGTDPGESKSMGPQMLFYDSDMEMYHWLAKHSPGAKIGYSVGQEEPLEEHEVMNIANIVTINAMIEYLVRSTTFDPEDGRRWRKKTHATRENVKTYVNKLKERRIHDPKEGKSYEGAADPQKFFESARDIIPTELQQTVNLLKGSVGRTMTDFWLRIAPPALVTGASLVVASAVAAASPLGVVALAPVAFIGVVTFGYSLIVNRDYDENTESLPRAISLRIGWGLERLRLSGRSPAALYSRRIIAPGNFRMSVRSRGLRTVVLDTISTTIAGNDVIWGDFIEELPKEADTIIKNKEEKGGHPSIAGPRF